MELFKELTAENEIPNREIWSRKVLSDVSEGWRRRAQRRGKEKAVMVWTLEEAEREGPASFASSHILCVLFRRLKKRGEIINK